MGRVPKPEGLVGGHGVYDAGLHAWISAGAQMVHHLAQARDAVHSHHPGQPPGDQVLLSGAQHDSAYVLQERPEILIVSLADHQFGSRCANDKRFRSGATHTDVSVSGRLRRPLPGEGKHGAPFILLHITKHGLLGPVNTMRIPSVGSPMRPDKARRAKFGRSK